MAKKKKEGLHCRRFSDFPPSEPESPETAYRRGYYHGYRKAAFDLGRFVKNANRWAAIENFIYHGLGVWMRRSWRRYVNGDDGKLHHDSYQKIEVEFPPNNPHV